MSAGYTPGPWSIFDQHDATRINVRGPNEEFVADCADGFYSDETDDWVMAEESLPNARLIAAAPELLKASEMALKALVGVDELMHRYGMMEGVDCPAIPVLQAAIAKATGDAQ